MWLTTCVCVAATRAQLRKYTQYPIEGMVQNASGFTHTLFSDSLYCQKVLFSDDEVNH